MDVSIIIVNWNTKNFLIECLNSIKSDIFSEKVEIIVIDNNSTDGSQEAVKKKFTDVFLISNKSNLGFAKANNIGINKSKAKYCCLVNSDIKVIPGCLKKMYDYMEKNTNIGILGPRILNTDLSIQRNYRKFPNLWTDFVETLGLHNIFQKSKYFSGSYYGNVQFDSPIRVDILTGCFLMVRRDALKEVGLLDNNFFFYGEDKDWCKRFWKANWKVFYFPNTQAIHYGQASSSKAPIKFFIELQHAQIQYYKKHYNLIILISFIIIRFLGLTFRSIVNAFSIIILPTKKQLYVQKLKKYLIAIRSLFM